MKNKNTAASASLIGRENIYMNWKEEKEVISKDASKKIVWNGNYQTGKWNEKDFRDNFAGHDLDVPSEELDDVYP